MTVSTVKIVCDDPRHARGKVARIATLQRAGDTWVRRSGDQSAVEEFTRPRPEGKTWGSARYRPAASETGGDRSRYRCKLCGTELACTEPVLDWLMNVVAEQGVLEPTLRLLNELVSRRT